MIYHYYNKNSEKNKENRNFGMRIRKISGQFLLIEQLALKIFHHYYKKC